MDNFEILKCEWGKGVGGFYILPFVAVGKMENKYYLWLGWLSGLMAIRLK